MAKKDEVKPVHPRTIHKALGAYLDDVNYLTSVVRNAHRFLTDDGLNADDVRKAVAPQIEEAIERMNKWSDAD